MRFPILLLYCLFSASLVWPSQDPYATLTRFNGTWRITRKTVDKPETMVNQCAKVGHFYACDQSVNGGAGALLVFIPRTDKPGVYYTQNIRPEGRATSRGDLEIQGDTWTFLSNWDDGGRTTYYRTVNTFVGRNRITFVQSESRNNKDWTVTNSGEEMRILSKH